MEAFIHLSVLSVVWPPQNNAVRLNTFRKERPGPSSIAIHPVLQYVKQTSVGTRFQACILVSFICERDDQPGDRAEEGQGGAAAASVVGKLTAWKPTCTPEAEAGACSQRRTSQHTVWAQDGFLSTMLSIAMERVEGVVGVGGAFPSIFVGAGAC